MLIVLGTKKRRRKRDDILDAVGVTLNAIRDSGDAFPPLKSAAACIVVILEMSQKIKSNREECERIAGKASKMLCEIWRQTKDYRDTLPQEIRDSINEIESGFGEIIAFVRELKDQRFYERYALQDKNKKRVAEFDIRLDESLCNFAMSVQLAILRLDTERTRCILSTEENNQKRHAEIISRIDIAQSTFTLSCVLFE